MKSFLLVVACLASASSVDASDTGHFKGGSLTWEPYDKQNKVDIRFWLTFKLSYESDNMHDKCTDGAIRSSTKLGTEGSVMVNGNWNGFMKYICTDYDEARDWASGYYIMPYRFSEGETKVDVSFMECCWPRTIMNNQAEQGSGRGFKLITTVDISPRHDTKKPNHPPISDNVPIATMQKGCKNTHYIQVRDPDGDDLHCRWTDASRNECNTNNMDICGQLFASSGDTDGVILNETECSIKFTRRSAAGIYAVAVMVEDFAKDDLNTPLSRISLQFMVELKRMPGKCRKPTLLGVNGFCTTVVHDTQIELDLRARSTSAENEITSFNVAKLPGVHVTPVSRIPGTDHDFSVTLTWTPTSKQVKLHSICYLAQEDHLISSNMFCIYIQVVDSAAEIPPPMEVVPDESVPSPGSGLTGNKVTVKFSKPIHKPSQPAFVSILEATTDVLVYKVDTSSSKVTINEQSLSFTLPSKLRLQQGNTYRISVDQTAAVSTDCEAPGYQGAGGQWNFLFESYCTGEDNSPLAVSRTESVPAPDAEMFGNVIRITYNREIQKPTDSAYITIYDTKNTPIIRVDTSGDEVSISGRTLSWNLDRTVPLEYRGTYRLRVGEGAAVSARECDRGLPAMADEWNFVFVTFCAGDLDYEPLTILPTESVPAPNTEMFGNVIRITYNKEIKKPRDSAYITIYNVRNVRAIRVDTSSDEVSISGRTLSFTVDRTVPLEYRGTYRLRVDEGAAVSARECDQALPPMAEWHFVFVTLCPNDLAFEPLAVVKDESRPRVREKFAGRRMTIKYNKEIRKPEKSAYISLLNTDDSVIHQFDTSSSEVQVIDGTSLSFTLPLNLGLESQGDYKIRVGATAALSAQGCDISRPDTVQWRFTFVTFCTGDGNSFQPLAVLPRQSNPPPGGNVTGKPITIEVQYNKPIKKPTSSAHISIVASDDSIVFAIDTTSNDVTINDDSLTFSLPDDSDISFDNDYRIIVDAGAVRSKRECDVALPARAEWPFRFLTIPGKLGPEGIRKLPRTLDCRDDLMQSFIPKSLVGDIDPSTMYLNDEKCTGRDYNQTHYVIETSYDACKTTVKVAQNENFRIVENMVHILPGHYTPGSKITRQHFIEIHLSCQVPKSYHDYQGLSFHPNLTTIVYYEKGYKKGYDKMFSLRMYEDQTYSRAYETQEFPVTIQQNRSMYLEGHVSCRGNRGNCDLMIDTCWATPTSNSFDATRYPFILHGCPIDDTVRLLASPSSRQERFAINSFAFLGDYIHGPVFLHCDMIVCNAGYQATKCPLTCESRRKRDISSLGSFSAASRSTSG